VSLKGGAGDHGRGWGRESPVVSPEIPAGRPAGGGRRPCQAGPAGQRDGERVAGECGVAAAGADVRARSAAGEARSAERGCGATLAGGPVGLGGRRAWRVG